jgi:hypothetical protein
VAPTGKDVVLLQGMRFYDVEEALQVPLLLYLPQAPVRRVKSHFGVTFEFDNHQRLQEVR